MEDSFEQKSKSQLNREELIAEMIVEASQGKRLLNLLIDRICIFLLVIPTSIAVIEILKILDGLRYIDIYHGMPFIGILEPVLISVYLIGYLVYYSLLEYLLGKTVGKILTRTRVLMANTGAKLTLMRIIGRSFARLIPFDAVSFLFSSGWHDTLTGTVVVNDDSLH